MPTPRTTAHVALALALVCIDEANLALASLRSAKVIPSMQIKAKAKAKVLL